MFKDKNLNGKVAIVTGGSKGIGKGIADLLKKQGAKVVVADMTSEKSPHMFVMCDVTKHDQVNELINKTLAKYKRIDILVNNAGIYPFVPFKDMSFEQWSHVLDVNLNGVFNCTKAVLPKMQQQGSGKIINIASIAGYVGFQGLVHYCTTKAGLLGFTRTLALELAKENIQVNAVAPGAIETPGVSTGLSPDALKGLISQVPAGRIGQPNDIAEAVAFLASSGADYITGQTLIVDGGFTLP